MTINDPLDEEGTVEVTTPLFEQMLAAWAAVNGWQVELTYGEPVLDVHGRRHFAPIVTQQPVLEVT